MQAARADLFRLLGDEDRLRLLALCAEEELTVGELATLLGESQPQVTKKSQALRDAARQFEEAFPGMSRTMIADKLAMTGTEKNIAFDAKGELVAAPALRHLCT